MPEPLGLYIHIPFCRSKCLYCAFNSVADEGFTPGKWRELLRDDFLSFCARESINASTHRLTSIYFGGGTPSLMPSHYIGSLISLMREMFPLPAIAGREEAEACDGAAGSGLEVTLEANPENLGMEKLEGFLRAGVNRLSLGLQSMNEAELKTLGRRHTADEARIAVHNAVGAGFTNISLDLMYGLPGQTLQSWTRTLNEAMELSCAHISLYNLSIEDGTPFYELYPHPVNSADQEKSFITEELELEMYERAISMLTRRGYAHYELSNFALPGFVSAHNQGYWLGRDYMGLGPGAHSYLGSNGHGRRLWNEKELSLYEKKVHDGCPAEGAEILSRDEAVVEAVMLGLRMLDNGIDVTRFREAFGEGAWQRLRGKCFEYERQGLLRVTSERVLLDRSALFTANEVCLGLVS